MKNHKKQQLKWLPINTIEQHTVAELHPIMSQEQYLALVCSIETYGYKEEFPLLLYRGKLIDGRHRLKVGKKLNLTRLPVTELPNNYTLQQVKEHIMATENRRAMTATQKAVAAYYATLPRTEGDKIIKGLSSAVATELQGVGINAIPRCKRIAQFRGERALQTLWEGNPIQLYQNDSNPSPMKTTSLSRLYTQIAIENKAKAKEEASHTQVTTKVYERLNRLIEDMIEIGSSSEATKTLVCNSLEQSLKTEMLVAITESEYEQAESLD